MKSDLAISEGKKTLASNEPQPLKQGVHGWLMLFCVLLIVVTPFRAFMNFFLAFWGFNPWFLHGIELSPLMQYVEFALLMALTFGFDLYRMVTAIFLWAKVPFAKPNAKTFLLVSPFVNIFWAVETMHSADSPGPVTLDELWPLSAIWITVSLAFSLIWWLYLSMSIRAKPQKAPNEAEEQRSP